MGRATAAEKNAALAAMAGGLREREGWLREENRKDLDAGASKGLSGAMLDRLALTGERIEQMAAGIEEVAFDRSGFHYHGRVKALAEAAREGGLKF